MAYGRILAVVVVLALASAAPVVGQAPEAAGQLPRHLPAEVAMTDAVPTPVTESAVTPVDLDDDGVDEILTLSRDGVAQLYHGDGSFAWSVSIVEVAHELGARPWNLPSAFEGDYRGSNSIFSKCRTTDHAVAFLDRNGDGHDDIVATTWLSTVEPVEEQRSYLVELDGRSGEIIGLHRFEGWVTNVVAAGGSELFVTEEDGPVELPPALDEGGRRRLERGTGGSTRIHRYDLDERASIWAYDTGVAWGQATAVASGPFAGTGSDLAVALTGPTGRPECTPDVNNGPTANEILVVDGRTGQRTWSAQAPRFVRRLLTAPDDGRADVVTQTRGRDGSAIARLDGASGASVWTARLPAGAVVWDVTTYGDDMAAAMAVPSHVGGSLPHAAVIDGATGAVEMNTVVEANPGSINRMRLAVVNLDGDEAALVVRTDRQTTAVTRAGTPLWTRRSLEAGHVLTATRGESGEWLWVQGPIPDSSTSLQPPDELFDSLEHGRYRLFGLDPDTGASKRTIAMVGPVVGLTRIDINGDGTPDRIMGGASETVFAFDGGSQRLLWSSFLGDPAIDVAMRGEEAGNVILDIEVEDVDADGELDLIIESHLEMFALSAADGRIIWSFKHGPSVGPGRWHGFELTDLNGDGVRDVVLGVAGGRRGGDNLVESAQVVAVNGADGTRLWQFPFPWPLKNVRGLDVGDVNGDGVDDVAVAVNLFFAEGLLYNVAVLDGATGVPVWQLHEHNGTRGGQHTPPMNAVRMIHADGDDDADVAVLRMGSNSFDTLLRVHDGGDGHLLWEADVESEELGVAMPGWGLYRGALDPEKPPVLIVGASARHDQRLFVQGFSPSGESIFTQAIAGPDQTMTAWTWDIEIGDVSGDGFGDVVVPWLHGFAVVDGAGAASGQPQLIGTVTDRLPSKVELFDVDGDGVDEIEALRAPGAVPVYVGHWGLEDPTFQSKAVFTLDLSG